MTKTVHLSGGLLRDGKVTLQLSPYDNWANFFNSIKPYLQHGVLITDIRLTSKVGNTITSVDHIRDGQELLVRAVFAPEETEWPQFSPTAATLRSPGSEVLPGGTHIVLHLGSDASAWKSLPRAQRRAIIQQLKRNDPPKDAALLRITMSPKEVDALLAALRYKFHYKNHQNSTFSPATSLATISDNWGVDKQWLSQMLKSSGQNPDFTPKGSPEQWDQRMLANLAILSEFTAGQAAQLVELLRSSIELRLIDPEDDQKAPVLLDCDVMRTINDVLSPVHPDRKNLSLSDVTKNEKARAKKREYQQRKKAKKGDKEVEAAAGKLGKAKVNDSEQEDNVD